MRQGGERCGQSEAARGAAKVKRRGARQSGERCGELAAGRTVRREANGAVQAKPQSGTGHAPLPRRRARMGAAAGEKAKRAAPLLRHGAPHTAFHPPAHSSRTASPTQFLPPKKMTAPKKTAALSPKQQKTARERRGSTRRPPERHPRSCPPPRQIPSPRHAPSANPAPPPHPPKKGMKKRRPPRLFPATQLSAAPFTRHHPKKGHEKKAPTAPFLPKRPAAPLRPKRPATTRKRA